PRAMGDELAVGCDAVRHGLGDEHAEGHVAYTPARISAAARSPERTAPSIAPYEIVAVSVPAQCTRPNGWRSSDPYLVRIPGGQRAIGQPRRHDSSPPARPTTPAAT